MRLIGPRLGLLHALLILGAVCPAQEKTPQKPPEVHTLEFTGPAEGWPPRVKGVTNVRQVHSKEMPASLTDEREAEIRDAALRDASVIKLLGTRFAYITIDLSEPEKCCPPRSTQVPLLTQLTFYSHSNNVAIEVQMSGTTVIGTRRLEGYQPPEGPEEIAAAIRLAQADPRIRDKVGGLNAFAMVSPGPEKYPVPRHRWLWVGFSKKGEDMPPIYSALVDLTEQKVATAGP